MNTKQNTQFHFLNLPNIKREQIEKSALDEFAEYDFDRESVNRIVKSSQIAKGTFYQYFEDKQDLLFICSSA